MKTFITPPLNHLELTEKGDGGLYIIGQYYRKNTTYREYVWKAKEQCRFLILDNGVGDEGEVLTNEELFALTLEIEPNEVIPLDVLYDSCKTIENFNQFVEWLKEAREYNHLLQTNLLGVPQGKDWKDWLFCYRYMLSSRYTSCIGLSKKAIPYIMGIDDIKQSRWKVYTYLSMKNLIKKDLHFLGQGDVTEFTRYRGRRHMRSTDSCYPILAAINGIDLSDTEHFKRIPTPSDYFDLKIDDSCNELIDKNIAFLKQCCKSK